MAAGKKKEAGFEETLQSLEKIVDRLESGELGLEESIKLFEEGVALADSAGKKLDEAEKKVTLLLKDKDGKLTQTPFDPEPEED
ncbi:exodeoxyribonuclease VII small subunit [bacterium]|nr:exodeoxyribonuclease VII small subunit [bacterium]